MATVIVVEKDNLCRLCLCDQIEDLFPDLDPIEDKNEYVRYILKCFNIQVTAEDNASKKLCLTCINKIKVIQDMMVTAGESDTVHKFLAQKKSASVSSKSATSSSVTVVVPRIEHQLPSSSVEQNVNQSSSLSLINSFLEKIKNKCPFCNYVMYNKRNIPNDFKYELCSKHNKPYACLIPSCNKVFATKILFSKHYRNHLVLPRSTFLCTYCHDVLKCSRNTMRDEHVHQDVSKYFQCCCTSFHFMKDFVMHKIKNHSSKIIVKSDQMRKWNNKHANNSSPDMDEPIPSTSGVTQSSSSSNMSNSDSEEIILYTCLFTGCDKIFSSKESNIDHYRQHSGILSHYFICGNCLNCNVNESIIDHCEHKNPLIVCKLCKINFISLHDLAKHKINYHQSVILCGTNNMPGCPYCNTSFTSGIDFKMHYPGCNKKIKCNTIKADLPEFSNVEENIGSYNCNACSKFFCSLKDYVEHSRKKHKNYLKEKDKDLKLCPLCDDDYYCSKLDDHIKKCTNSLRINDSNYFGCIYCKLVKPFENPQAFRYHLMFCKTFLEYDVGNDRVQYKCINCNFLSYDFAESILHAVNRCIYFKLKMKYAINFDEKSIVIARMKIENDNMNQSFLQPGSSNYFPDNVPNNDLSEEEITRLRSQPGCSKYLNNAINKETSGNPNSKLFCDRSKRRLLESYHYFCNICSKLFLNCNFFEQHLNIDGNQCRSDKLLYCRDCLTDFNNEYDYQKHFEFNNRDLGVPLAIPIHSNEQNSYIKTEIMDLETNEVVDNNQIVENDNVDSQFIDNNVDSQFIDNNVDVKIYEANLGDLQFQEESEDVNNIEMECVIEEKLNITQNF